VLPGEPAEAGTPNAELHYRASRHPRKGAWSSQGFTPDIQRSTLNIEFEDENKDEDELENGVLCNSTLRICPPNLPLANRLRVLF